MPLEKTLNFFALRPERSFIIVCLSASWRKREGEKGRVVATGEATRRRSDVEIFCSNFSWQEPT